MSEMPTIFWYKTQNSDEFGKQWKGVFFGGGGGSRLDNLDKQEKNAIESSLSRPQPPIVIKFLQQ